MQRQPSGGVLNEISGGDPLISHIQKNKSVKKCKDPEVRVTLEKNVQAVVRNKESKATEVGRVKGNPVLGNTSCCAL